MKNKISTAKDILQIIFYILTILTIIISWINVGRNIGNLINNKDTALKEHLSIQYKDRIYKLTEDIKNHKEKPSSRFDKAAIIDTNISKYQPSVIDLKIKEIKEIEQRQRKLWD